MSIQRYGFFMDYDNDLSEMEDGNYVKYSDHLAAMKEQEDRMLRFAEWFGFDCMDEDKNLPNFNTAKEAFQYWEKEVEGMK